MHNLLSNNSSNATKRSGSVLLLDFIEVEGLGEVGVYESFYKDGMLVAEAARMTSPSCKRVLDLPIFSVITNDIGN